MNLCQDIVASFSIGFAESFVPSSFYEMLLARLIQYLQSHYIKLTGNADASFRIEDQILTRSEAILKLRTEKLDPDKDICFRVTGPKISGSDLESKEALTVEVIRAFEFCLCVNTC